MGKIVLNIARKSHEMIALIHYTVVSEVLILIVHCTLQSLQ